MLDGPAAWTECPSLAAADPQLSPQNLSGECVAYLQHPTERGIVERALHQTQEGSVHRLMGSDHDSEIDQIGVWFSWALSE